MNRTENLAAETERLFRFGSAAKVPSGGFAWLDSQGAPTPGKPLFLYVTCRMTHAFSLGHLLGRAGAAQCAEHGLDALERTFRDPVHDGWFAAVEAPGSSGSADRSKQSYPHAFVVLAAASATVAGLPRAKGLLEEALGVFDTWFWDEAAGMAVERWDESFSVLDDYRGANSNMHCVEAFLAAFGATGATIWLDRAERIAERMMTEAGSRQWRLPEHYDRAWKPLPELYRERPSDPFRPYGATIGHALEWSRLLLHLRAAQLEAGRAAATWLLPTAEALFSAAVRDGWEVDGRPGFVYTVDWDGEPVIHQRLHWVLCEALGTASALRTVTGDESYDDWFRTWWDYAETHLIDRVDGSWHHELDRENRPAATVRDGKADIYHALQATLLPRVPLGSDLATNIARS